MVVGTIPTRVSRMTAMTRGFMRRCPRCGQGAIFAGLLRFTPNCSVCGEQLGNIRADDLPAYLTVLVTGHVVVPLMFFGMFTDYSSAAVVTVSIIVASALMALLLPSFKGAVAGLLWSLGMPEGAPEEPSL